MRKLLAGTAVVAVTLIPAALLGPGASASTATKTPPAPVKIPGKVTNHGTATAAGGTIELDQHDFFYRPTFVKVPAGVTSLTVMVKNLGSNQHTFTVPSLKVDQVLNPGQTMVVTVPISGAGAFLFYCRFHKSLGMQGAFFTKKGAKLVAATGAGSSKSPSSSSGGGSGGGSSSGGYGY